MNYYYIPSATEQGYEQIEESEFFAMVAERQCANYASKVYRGEMELTSVPEEFREIVKTKVEKRFAQYQRNENASMKPHEALLQIRKLSASALTRGEAKSLFSGIEKLREGATDAVASTAVSVFPRLKEDGSLVKAGTRINWYGVLKRAAVDLWDTAENNPDNAPVFWEDISYREGHRTIPETITVGLAFGLGECGWWKDVLYRSKIAANVYTPDQYPDGWEVVE